MSERRARVRTTHSDPATVAAALRPDDAPSMTTRAVDDGGDGQGVVVSEFARDRTGGLRSTLDDYLVNLGVAERTVRAADALDADGGTDADERTADATDTHDT